jgi:hypothetical protein
MLSNLADVSKARQLLGWEPQVSLAEGMRRLVDWYLAERDWASQVTGKPLHGMNWLRNWRQDRLLSRVLRNSSYLFASNAIGAVLSIVTANLLGWPGLACWAC